MRRRLLLAAATLLHAASCTGPRVPEARLVAAPESNPLPSHSGERAAPSIVTEAGSEFHLVAEGWPSSEENRSLLTLCQMNGAVFVCGQGSAIVQRGDRLVREPTLEAGLPGGRWISDVVGRWPDSAWLTSTHCWSGNCSHLVYRWSGSRWVQVLDVPYGTVDLSVHVVPWKDGALVRISEVDDHGEHPTVKLVPLNATGLLPEFPAPLPSPSICSSELPLPALEWAATPLGDLIGLTTDCQRKLPLLARWPGGSGTPILIDFPPCADGVQPVASLLTIGSAFALGGGCGLAASTYLARLDGNYLRLVDTKGLNGFAIGYSVTPTGEYVLLAEHRSAGSSLALRVVKRGRAGWESIPLPSTAVRSASCAGTHSGEAIEPRPIVPRALWTVGAETWLGGYTIKPECAADNGGVLLRSSPTSEVFHLR